MVEIAEMENAGVKIGKRLEIIMFEGAEFKPGCCVTPPESPQGFEPGDHVKGSEGERIIGYVSQIESGRIFLRMIVGKASPDYQLRDCYVQQGAIHSYQLHH